MEYIHKQKKYQPEMLADKSVLALINATNDVLSKELDNLSVKQDIPEDLVSTLRKNVFFFSGFKTHHELEEASRMLQSDDGGFKPFGKFYEDVKAIDATYNRNYLQAEYNFATASTQMAVKWKEWEKTADRYDLQYRTAGDDRVREEHRELEGITLPMTDPFWNEYFPPNGWNCRCTAVRVRKGKYPTSDSDDAIQKGKNCTATPKQQIFRFNPGKQERIFPEKHPYFKVSGEVKKILETYQSSTRKYRPTSEEKKKIRNEYEEFVQTLPSVKVGNDISHRKDVCTAGGDVVIVIRKFFSETFSKAKNHGSLEQTMQIAMDFEKWIPNLTTYQKEHGKHHDCDFAVFHFEYNDIHVEMKAMINEDHLKAYTLRIIQ